MLSHLGTERKYQNKRIENINRHAFNFHAHENTSMITYLHIDCKKLVHLYLPI